MSVVEFRSRSISRKEVKKAIEEGKAQYLCEGRNWERFYFLNNSIVATWEEDPFNQFDSQPTAGVLDLDDFLAEVKEIEKMPKKEKENIARIIGENEAAIREREHNRDLKEAQDSLNGSLKHLIYCIKHLEELGIKGEWFISRDGQTLIDTTKEDTLGMK